MSAPKDSLGAIARDAAAAIKARASAAAAAVKPHVTMDNAVKVVGLVNGVLDAAEKARRIQPGPPATKKGPR